MNASKSPNSNDMSVTARFILFVTGDSPRSRRARNNLSRALQDHPDLDGKLETYDVLLSPKKLVENRVFATPALMYKPVEGEPSFLYGDLSNPLKLQELLSYDEEKLY